MPIQADFILRRLVEMVDADPALADRQPWKAAREKDAAWLRAVITDPYAGDDGEMTVMAGGMLDFTRQDVRPSPRLLLLHDDGEREFAYTARAEKSLERA